MRVQWEAVIACSEGMGMDYSITRNNMRMKEHCDTSVVP